MPIRLTCSSITFRSEPAASALRDIRAFGFATVELAVIPGFCPHFDAATASARETDAFVSMVRESGLRVPLLTAVPGHFNAPDADDEAIRAAASANIHLARRLGASMLNIHAGRAIGTLDDRRGFDDHARRVAPGLAAIARQAEEVGLRLGLEAPHRNGLCRTLDETARVLELVDAEGARNVDLLLDVTHVHAGGARPEDALGFFGERIAHVHLRDGKGEDIFFVPGAGEIDFTSFLRALDRSGYRGLCGLELEGHGETRKEKRDGLARALAHLRAVATDEPGLVFAT